MERLKYLLEQYAANESTEEEVREFFTLIKRSGDDEPVRSMLMELMENTPASSNYDTERWNKVIRNVMKQDAEVVTMYPKKIFTFTRIAAAAVIILLLSVGGYFYFTPRHTRVETVQKERFKNDVAPGGNKAILTLADGTQIILDSAANGSLAQQGNTKILKLDDGQLAYNVSSSNGKTLYNTISTPRGGQYQIILPDKSKVWLNAASSLRFPASFTGKGRNVELTGEAYFEIAHNASMPFVVQKNDVSVQVLGTHFNVNSYDDEAAMKVTLLEGSVKVTLRQAQGDKVKMLKPGQQAILRQTGDNNEIKVADADVNETVAWKNGVFSFKSADIETIMRQVARWYDVEVVFEGKLPSQHYNGETSRNLSASQMLKVLEEAGIKFRIEGKKIIVMP